MAHPGPDEGTEVWMWISPEALEQFAKSFIGKPFTIWSD